MKIHKSICSVLTSFVIYKWFQRVMVGTMNHPFNGSVPQPVIKPASTFALQAVVLGSSFVEDSLIFVTF